MAGCHASRDTTLYLSHFQEKNVFVSNLERFRTGRKLISSGTVGSRDLALENSFEKQFEVGGETEDILGRDKGAL